MRSRKRRQSSNAPKAFPGERYHRRMRKLLTWLAVTLGIAALVRKLRRRRDEPALVSGVSPPAQPASPERAVEVEPSAPPETEDPAAELRQRLADSRTEENAPPAPEAGSVEERRTEVHEQGRAALDEMQPSDEG
jgi:hypothetical protein